MKKEKTIRTYQRRTKTGKIVTVKQHTAKYDAAEALKEAAKKKGAGDEIEQRRLDAEWKKIEDDFMKKHPDFEAFDDEGNETKENAAIIKKKEAFTKKHPSWKGGVKSGPKEKSAKRSIIEKAPKSDSSYGFTPDEYKAWYHWDQDADPKNKSALKVEKALKKQMGTKAYNKYFDDLTDNYSARGHNKAFKGLSETLSTGEKKSGVLEASSKSEAKSVKDLKAQMRKAGVDPDKRLTGKKATEAKKDLVSKGFTQKKDEYGDTYLMKGKEVYHYIKSGILVGGAHLDKITGGKDYDKAKKLFGEKSATSSKETKRSKEDKSKSKSTAGVTGDFKGHPKVMAKIDKLVQSYQKDIEKAQKHIDAGEVRPGGKFSRRMSYKEQKKYAEKQIKELEKGRETHLAGKENKAWRHLRNFVGFSENNVVGKETRAKNKVAAEKKQQKRENDRIKQAQLHAQRVAESVERSRKKREAMSSAKRIPADLLKKATTKSRNGKHPVTSIYYGDKILVGIGGTYYRVTKAEMKDISAAMPSKPAKRYTK